MDVEPADVEDVDHLADLWVEMADGQRDHGSHLLADANRERVREAMARHAVVGGLLVAREDDETVGFVMFEPTGGGYVEDVRCGVVRNLYVVPDRRGGGVGSTLLAAAEDALATAGVDVVRLEVIADNDRARAFYADRGYEPHRVEFEKPLGSEDTSNEGG